MTKNLPVKVPHFSPPLLRGDPFFHLSHAQRPPVPVPPSLQERGGEGTQRRNRDILSSFCFVSVSKVSVVFIRRAKLCIRPIFPMEVFPCDHCSPWDNERQV